MSSWYFETSGFNYLLSSIDFGSFLNTRELQHLRGRQLYMSPITLWEVMLTSDDIKSDFLIFSAQNLFFKKMLATPTELMTRYLRHSYAANKIDYDIYTGLEIGKIWSMMTTDNSVRFQYSKSKLKEKASILRKVSRNLPSIIFNNVNPKDDLLFSISKIVTVHYECLRADGFLPKSSKYDEAVFFKLVVLFAMLFFVLRIDFDSNVIVDFWNEQGVNPDDPTKILTHLFEKYPEILRRGPLLEMATMAYNQVMLGATNRGLLLDCYHMVYAPYVDYIVTGDNGFSSLKNAESHYDKKILHVSELNFKSMTYHRRQQSSCCA